MSPRTIGDVVNRLDSIIEQSRRERSRAGYFALLYRGVTVRVRDGIRNGRFDDGDRMERLDVRFARRYFDAYDAYSRGNASLGNASLGDTHRGDASLGDAGRRNAGRGNAGRGNALTQSWQVAFEAAERWGPLVLQHLLLGMNAHINLDLGIAAARTCPGPAIVGLERDFREINAILLGILDDVQDCLSAISPWSGMLDLAGGDVDELVARTGLTGTRDWAWMNALHLAAIDEDRQRRVIERIDRSIAEVGLVLLSPGPWFAVVQLLVRLGERGSVDEVMDALVVPT